MNIRNTSCVLTCESLLLTCILLEKLTSSHLTKEFRAFYGTRKFITIFTSALHLALSSTRAVQKTSLLRDKSSASSNTHCSLYSVTLKSLCGDELRGKWDFYTEESVGDICGPFHVSVGVSFNIYRNHTCCAFGVASTPITTLLPTGEEEFSL
jgi:hypothetical protein